MKHTNIITYYKNNSKSYLPHTDKLPKIAVDFIWNKLLKGEDKKVKSLLSILRKEHELNIKNDGYAPIPYETFKKYKYNQEIERLKDLGYVEYTDYSYNRYGTGKCREYRLPWDLYNHIDGLIPGRVANFTENNWQFYNGITNTAIRKTKRKIQHDIYQYNNHKKKNEIIVSQIVEEGIIPIEYCFFDFHNVEYRLNYKRDLLELGKLNQSEKLSYLNDERCYRNILMNGFTIDKERRNLLAYKPRYRGQKTGRKSEIGGGFQSCSREQKHEAFFFMPRIRNYDLKSSQMYGLKFQLMSARMDTSIVDRYIGVDKTTLANAVGVDVDCWKGIMYGTYFGGFPTSKFNKEGKLGKSKLFTLLRYDIVKNHICKFLKIETWYNYDKKRRECESSIQVESGIRNILQKFYDQNKELIKLLQDWREYLVTNFFQSSFDAVGNKKYIWNRSNMPLEMTQYMDDKGVINSQGKRDLASHLLQGQEACFISRLTWYSQSEPECPYRVISDQHDGLIVHGFIPEDYVEKARLDTGFEYAYLVEKSYK